MDNVKEISVFVDESGSFNPDVGSSRFYIVCMVFHDQQDDISKQVKGLSEELAKVGFPVDAAVHIGPLIRREKEFRNMDRETRRIVVHRMLSFFRKVDVQYRCFVVDKRFVDNAGNLHDALLQAMTRFLVDHADVLNEYDKLKVYYDNGQSSVSGILREAFMLFSSKTEFVQGVTPYKYRLFQVADLVCTLELIKAKLTIEGRLSDSEFAFFRGIHNLKKNYLKVLSAKAMK